MIYHPREEWEPWDAPVDGPDSVPAEWRYNTLHWPGSPIDISDPAGTLHGMQTSWVASKGYSLGYNWAVFPDGGIWEIRSWDIRCAANGDGDVNRAGVAILLAVPDVYTDPTDAMGQSVRDLVAETRTIVDQRLYINGHRDVRPEPTACPGDVIYHLIGVGWFEPTPPLPFEEDDLTDAQAQQLAELHDALVKGVSGFTDPFGNDGINAAWSALWAQQRINTDIVPALQNIQARLAALEQT